MPSTHTDDLVQDLAARLAAQEALTRAFVCADRRDRDGAAAVLGERIALDYTSLVGGEPGELSRDDLLAAWAQTLGGFESTQHLLGSFISETVAGHCDAVLRRDQAWQLAALTLHLDWSAGNQQLATLAAAGVGQ